MNPSVQTTPQLMLAADHYNRYPGELVTLYLRFTAPAQPNVTLQIAMPHVMQAESYRLPPGVPAALPSVIEHNQEVIILIPLESHFTAGQSYDLEIGARINTFYANQHLEIETRLVTADALQIDTASLRLTIFGKGRYLQHLPELYESDDFTGRFLMLFESFWKPINQQIDQMDSYFDPALTPPGFIPWLASWMGMPVDPSLPLDRVRALLKNALMLFQCRGTHHALKTYIEIYTSGQVTIRERRATNFILGQTSTLGMETALGKDNQPNSLQIHITVTRAELERTRYSAETYKRKMREIVLSLVPAHIQYEVDCEFTAVQSS